MTSYRFLDPFNSRDCNHFNSILEHYSDFEKNRKIKLYGYESIKDTITWLKDSFNKFSQKDFVVSAKFEDGELEKIIIAYKLKIVFGETVHLTSDNVLPYSYLSLIYSKDKTWNSPEEDIRKMSLMVSEHFENQGITKMLITTRLSKKILKADSISEFLNNDFIKTFSNSSKKYFLNLEAVFFNQEDLDRYNSSVFKGIIPQQILKPVMLVSWHLKPEFVLNNCINRHEHNKNHTV